MGTVAEIAGRSGEPSAKRRVLAVDLDGTLVKTDLLLECIVALLRYRPWCIVMLPLWLLRGRAHFKHEIARRTELDVNVLPYRERLLDLVKARRAQGYMTALATAADARIARQIADHLGVFDFVFASDGSTNLTGQAKRDRLVAEFGERGFDYAGNASSDLPVWRAGRGAIVVNPSARLRSSIIQTTRLVLEIDDAEVDDAAYRFRNRVRALRPQHWLKNLLLFVPLLAAHRANELHLIGKLVLGFLAFGCIASAGYLVNDLLDLASDRHHPIKRSRPFAAGELPLSYALSMIPLLVLAGCLIGRTVSGLFLAATLTYLGLSLTYSLFVKQIVILDVIFLAGLYTMRLLAGSAAVAIAPSHWLLALSTFLFLSLALVKRYGELAVMKRINGDHAKARAYELTDAELLSAMGIASGYLAVLVLALYINSEKAPMLYSRYQLMWFLCPLLLYWISNIWLIAHRGRMPDDPVMFAIEDRTSRILILLMFAISVLAL